MDSIGLREMAGKIFISYRRGVDSAFAGRLFDSLTEAFGRGQVFMDVDDISPGQDFARVLEERIESDVVLAVIGKGWLAARKRLDETSCGSRSRRPLTRRTV